VKGVSTLRPWILAIWMRAILPALHIHKREDGMVDILWLR